MNQRFTPELIDEDIEAALSHRASEPTPRLIRALAALYAPPEEADVALERVRVRVRRGLVSLRDTASAATAPVLMPPGERPSSTRRGVRAASQMRAALGALAAVLVIALVTTGFVYVFQSRGHGPRIAGQPTATTARLLSTPTPLPGQAPSSMPVTGTPPAWETYPVPASFIQQQTQWGFAVSASNGTTAYLCTPVLASGSGGAQVPEIWATTDRGLQWKHIGDLPALGQVADCSLDVDAFDSSRLVAMLSGYNVATLAGFVDSFSSSDGGRSWQLVAQGTDISRNSVQIQNIATYQGKTYAIYWTTRPFSAPTPTPDPNLPGQVLTDLQSHLSVSADGMHTWQPIDAPILALTGSEQTVKQYWARVDSGGHLVLLAEVGAAPVWDSTTPEPEDTLWLSRDAGTHWTQLPAPLMSGFTARASADGQSWLICGSSRALETSAGRQAMNACSADSGETWTTRPLLRTCEACGEPLGDGNLESGGTYLASDGSLVQVAEDQTKGTLALYQLPANSSQWQYLGPMPDGDTVMYAPTATGGLLWACSAGTVVGSPLDGIIGGAGNSTGVIYTAIYPG